MYGNTSNEYDVRKGLERGSLRRFVNVLAMCTPNAHLNQLLLHNLFVCRNASSSGFSLLDDTFLSSVSDCFWGEKDKRKNCVITFLLFVVAFVTDYSQKGKIAY